jgi:hypothetical protein
VETHDAVRVPLEAGDERGYVVRGVDEVVVDPEPDGVVGGVLAAEELDLVAAVVAVRDHEPVDLGEDAVDGDAADRFAPRHRRHPGPDGHAVTSPRSWSARISRIASSS